MTLSIRMKHNGPSMYAADFVRNHGTPEARVVLHLEPGEEGDVHVWAGDGALTVVETLPKNVAKAAPVLFNQAGQAIGFADEVPGPSPKD